MRQLFSAIFFIYIGMSSAFAGGSSKDPVKSGLLRFDCSDQWKIGLEDIGTSVVRVTLSLEDMFVLEGRDRLPLRVTDSAVVWTSFDEGANHEKTCSIDRYTLHYSCYSQLDLPNTQKLAVSHTGQCKELLEKKF